MKKEKSLKKKTDKELEKIIEKEFNSLAKILHKAICEMLGNMGSNNTIIESIVEFMKNEPSVFAFSRDAENRNFLKWAISENIKQNKLLLKQICKVEKKFNLPLEHPETPTD
ncbi:MAG: hypothetical protein FWE16_03955 [Firmicutes bacterium]|nr:hypothetical protein [Bacillota bacterium]